MKWVSRKDGTVSNPLFCLLVYRSRAAANPRLLQTGNGSCVHHAWPDNQVVWARGDQIEKPKDFVEFIGITPLLWH